MPEVLPRHPDRARSLLRKPCLIDHQHAVANCPTTQPPRHAPGRAAYRRPIELRPSSDCMRGMAARAQPAPPLASRSCEGDPGQQPRREKLRRSPAIPARPNTGPIRPFRGRLARAPSATSDPDQTATDINPSQNLPRRRTHLQSRRNCRTRLINPTPTGKMAKFELRGLLGCDCRVQNPDLVRPKHDV